MYSRRAAVVLTVCLLVTSLIATPVAADREKDLANSMTGEHFVVEYDDGYRSSAETTLTYLREIRTQLQAETPVDTTIDDKITVRLHSMDDWSHGENSLHWHDRPYRINLIAPSDWRTVKGVDEYYIRKNLAHEYANIMLYEYVDGHGGGYHNRYPEWFAEGLSEYYAYHNVSSDIPPNYDPGVGEFERLIEEDSGYFAVMAQDQYAGGHMLLHYVIDEYGEKAVFAMFRSEAETFPEVVQSELGVSYDAFKKRWLVWAEANVGGDYAVSEGDISKMERIRSLESTLQRQNETIATLRDRFSEKNETIAELRHEVESPDGTGQGGQENDGTSRTDGRSAPRRTETGSDNAGLPTDVGDVVAGVAGGLATLALAGGVLALRDRW